MLIDSNEAQKIVNASKQKKESSDINFDLGFTKKSVFLEKNTVLIDEHTYKLALFLKIAKSKAIYELNEKAAKIAFFNEKYYKLVPIINSAPTLEIDGIRMHRTKNMTPLKDAESKIDLIEIKPTEDVLDICTGLGYTAIESYRKKAKVTTVEIDSNVLDIARKNPYSQELFQAISQNEIHLINDDAFFAIKKFRNNSFDAILHDPPRFALSGELYSEEFYKELYRILRRDGRVFHYVGSPGVKYRKKDFIRGIKKRMINTGFKIKKIDDNESVYGYK